MSGSDEGETNSTFQLRNRISSNVRINVDNSVVLSESDPLERSATELEWYPEIRFRREPLISL